MSAYNFKVSLSPKEALDLVKQNQKADLVFEENQCLSGGIWIGILVFEKYFMRVKSKAALVVIINNIDGQTDIHAISTGDSEGITSDYFCNAVDSLAGNIKKFLADFII